MNEKLEKNIKVNILGREYTIKSDEEEGHICQVADYVNRKIVEMKDRGGNNPINALVFTALTIADDYLRLKKQEDEFISRLEHKIIELDGISKEDS
jgi:cell division protein ZapA